MEKAQFVFSYAREDSDFVLKLAKELRANSVNVWLDQIDIVAGEPWGPCNRRSPVYLRRRDCSSLSRVGCFAQCYG